MNVINSTFPVVHGLEHPLVVGLLYEDHVTAYTVRGVVSESLLHGHAGVNLSDQTLNRRLCRFGGNVVYCMRLPLLLIAWNAASHCGIL